MRLSTSREVFLASGRQDIATILGSVYAAGEFYVHLADPAEQSTASPSLLSQPGISPIVPLSPEKFSLDAQET